MSLQFIGASAPFRTSNIASFQAMFWDTVSPLFSKTRVGADHTYRYSLGPKLRESQRMRVCSRVIPSDGADSLALTNRSRQPHHTRQAFWLTIGCPALHENAFWNSGEFSSVP